MSKTTKDWNEQEKLFGYKTRVISVKKQNSSATLWTAQIGLNCLV